MSSNFGVNQEPFRTGMRSSSPPDDYSESIDQEPQYEVAPFLLAGFRLRVAPSGSCSLRIGDYVHPLRIRRDLGIVVVVPVPPLVRRGLGITLRRVLPSLLTAERRDVEMAPDAPHRLVAAVVDEVCAVHLVGVAEEHVVAVPFCDAEVRIEAVGHGVPGHLPSHPRLQTRDVSLRRA